MKRIAIGIIIVASILVLLAPGVSESIMLFILIGAIPGTTLSIPPLVMMGLMAALLLLVISWAIRQEFYVKLRPLPTPVPHQSVISKKAKASIANRRSISRRAAKRRLARQTQTA